MVKVYKYKKYFFADLSKTKERRRFIKDDFYWNRLASPRIYKKLLIAEGNIFDKEIECKRGDFFILMKRIDDKATLANLLQENRLSKNKIRKIVDDLLNVLQLLTKEKMLTFEHLAELNYQQFWQENAIDSLDSWLNMVEKYIPKKKAKRIISILKKASKQENYFINYDKNLLTVVVDSNSNNILWLNGKPGFIDVMPPKESWRIADEIATIVRVAVDVDVIGRSNGGKIVYDAYQNYRNIPSGNVLLIYEIWAGVIQWAYQHLLG